MTEERLSELQRSFSDRNLQTELEWATFNTKSGYFKQKDADFISWLCYTALKEIKKNERHKGQWLNGDCKGGNCSQCGKYAAFSGYSWEPIFKYCPNCGAEME